MENKVELFVDTYLKQIFYWALKKTSSTEEAEELTHDIALEAIKGIKSGISIENFSGWIWRLVHNRYAHWAIKKAKNSEVSDIELLSGISDGSGPLDAVIDKEETKLLYRELALLKMSTTR